MKRNSLENDEELCRNINEIEISSNNFLAEKKNDSAKSNFSNNCIYYNFIQLQSNYNGPSSPKSALNRIDDEIGQVKEMQKTVKCESKNKNRTCDHCIIC